MKPTKEPAKGAKKNILAIAYAWLQPPALLGIGDSVLFFSWQSNDDVIPAKRILPIRLPDRHTNSDFRDIAGILGLLHPVDSKSDDERAEAFERSLSDLLLWLTLGKTQSHDGETIVLLQGPLLPKIRGRFLYLGLPSNIRIYGVTCDSKWTSEISGYFYSANNKSDAWKVLPMHPPPGISCGTRSWCAKRNKEAVYFELIANMEYQQITEEWQKDREKELADLLNVASSKEAASGETSIPSMLASVRNEVASFRLEQRVFLQVWARLKEIEFDQELAKKDPLLIPFFQPSIEKSPSYRKKKDESAQIHLGQVELTAASGMNVGDAAINEIFSKKELTPLLYTIFKMNPRYEAFKEAFKKSYVLTD